MLIVHKSKIKSKTCDHVSWLYMKGENRSLGTWIASNITSDIHEAISVQQGTIAISIREQFIFNANTVLCCLFRLVTVGFIRIYGVIHSIWLPVNTCTHKNMLYACSSKHLASVKLQLHNSPACSYIVINTIATTVKQLSNQYHGIIIAWQYF